MRESVGARQDDVGQAARAHGLSWGQSRVAALERGEKPISAEELALLPLILTDVCDRSVTLADLIAPEATIVLAPRAEATGQAVLSIYASMSTDDLVGVNAPFPTPEQIEAFEKVRRAMEWSAPIRERLRRLMLVTEDRPVSDERKLIARQREIGITDERVARRIGEHPLIVVNLAHALWGRTLAEERDRLVAERTDAGGDPARLRALRGRVTRQLVEQLTEEIRRRETGSERGERQETP